MTANRLPPLPIEMEIVNLEHRIAFLKERQAGLTKMGKVALVGLAIMVPLVFVILTVGAIMTNQNVALALALPTFLFVVALLGGWLGRDLPLSSFGIDKSTSYGLSMQASIETCERQLAELRKQL